MRFLTSVAGVAMAWSVVMASGVAAARAQMGEFTPPGAKVPLGQQVSPSVAMNDMLSMFEYELVGVAKAMPAEKYNFAPPSAGGAKFDGVRTFAQQVLHLTQGNYYFYGSMSGMKPDVDMKAIGALTKKEDIVAALEKSFVFAHKAVATITPANAFTAIKPVDGMSTAATIAAFAVAHGYDHYGQLVEYLRLNGVVPPGSK